MNKISGFLEDHTGGNSSVRLYALIAVVSFFGVWTFLSIRTGQMADPPEMIVLAMSAIVFGKVIQRFGEKDAEVSTQTTTTTTENTKVVPEKPPANG